MNEGQPKRRWLPRPRVADYLWMFVVLSLSIAHWLRPVNEKLLAERDLYYAEAAMLKASMAMGVHSICHNFSGISSDDPRIVKASKKEVRSLVQRWNAQAASDPEMNAESYVRGGRSVLAYERAQKTAREAPIESWLRNLLGDGA